MKRVVLVLVVLGIAGCKGDSSRAENTPPAAAPPKPAPTPAAVDTTADMTQRPLWKGDRFPDVELRDLKGNPVQTAALLGGREAIVLFASTTCEACHNLVSVWEQLRPQFPKDYPVFAIVDEEVELAQQYVDEKKFPFPLYCDTKSTFYTDYLVDTYPTVTGVGADGVVLYMVRQASPLLTPEAALHMFLDAKGEHKH